MVNSPIPCRSSRLNSVLTNSNDRIFLLYFQWVNVVSWSLIMRTVDLILRKRGGEELSVEEIRFLINGYTTGEIPDYQISAFLMATYFSGMTDRELSSFTEVMIGSGEVLACPIFPASRSISIRPAAWVTRPA